MRTGRSICRDFQTSIVYWSLDLSRPADQQCVLFARSVETGRPAVRTGRSICRGRQTSSAYSSLVCARNCQDVPLLFCSLGRYDLEIYLRSLKMLPFESFGTVYYSHSVAIILLLLLLSVVCTNVTDGQTDTQYCMTAGHASPAN